MYLRNRGEKSINNEGKRGERFYGVMNPNLQM